MHGRRRVVIEVDATAHGLLSLYPDATLGARWTSPRRSSGCCSPPVPSIPTSRRRSGSSERRARRAAPTLYLYLIDDGVRALDDPRIRALPDRGAKLFVCAYGCQKRRLPLRDADRVTYCGLVVLTDLINGTDRFIALN